MLNLFIHIETLNGSLYYNLSYFLSSLIVIGYALYWGNAKKIPLIPWTLTVVTILLFFIAGTRLFSMNVEDWQYFFTTGRIHLSNGRTVLGGIILAIPAAIFCSYFFKLNFDFSKPFVLVMPVAIVLMRIGCLLVGCCYGTQSDLPWAVCYNPNSAAFINQVNKGLIAITDSHSLPVHPAQLYDIIFYLLIFFVVIKLRNKLKANHSLFFVILVSRFVERFFLEFVREGESNNVFGIEFSGLKIVQWTLLLLIASFIFTIYFREKNFVQSAETEKIKTVKGIPVFIFCIFISVALVLVKPWMMRLEMIVIDWMMITAIVSICIYEIKQIKIIHLKFAPITMALICFVLMSQTVDMNPFPNYNTHRPDYNSFRKIKKDSTNIYLNDFFEFGFGYSQGNYNYQVTPGSGGCSGPATVHNHNQTFDIEKINLAFKHYLYLDDDFRDVNEKSTSLTFSAKFEKGNIIDNDLTQSYTMSSHYFNLNPNVTFDSRRFGFGIGVLLMLKNKPDSNNLLLNPIIPSFYLRYGNPRVFYVALFINNRLEDAFPIIVDAIPQDPLKAAIPFRAEIGSQCNIDNFLLRMGISYDGYYFAPSFYFLKKQFIVNPYMYLISADKITSGNHFGLNLSYRIPARKVRGY